MTWYASQIFAQPTPSVRQLFADNPMLTNHLYLVNHLEGHQWPQAPEDPWSRRHGLPAEGLLVVRELCQPGTPEFAWQGTDAVAWDKIESSERLPILRLTHLPTVSNGKIYFDNQWAGGHPPIAFLKVLKEVSATTRTTVCFYHHASGAERSAGQEIAWLFGAEDCVYVGYYPEYEWVSKFTADGASQLPGVGHEEGKTVLQHVLNYFGLELSSRYFASHTRDFDWQQYKI
jgi:hypothetical protein